VAVPKEPSYCDQTVTLTTSPTAVSSTISLGKLRRVRANLSGNGLSNNRPFGTPDTETA
jgi:hypothetical protein